MHKTHILSLTVTVDLDFSILLSTDIILFAVSMSSLFTLYVRGLIFLSPVEINTAICRFGWMAATCRTASVGPLNCRWQYLHMAVFFCKKYIVVQSVTLQMLSSQKS